VQLTRVRFVSVHDSASLAIDFRGPSFGRIPVQTQATQSQPRTHSHDPKQTMALPREFGILWDFWKFENSENLKLTDTLLGEVWACSAAKSRE